MLPSLNRVEISRSALRHNFRLCSRYAGSTAVMPMIKADGYGHGMIECARIFAAEGAAAFGVGEACEGVALRRAGIEQPILVVVGVMEETLDDVLTYGLSPVITSGDLLPELSRKALAKGCDVGVHLKVDSGMGRQGCLPEELPELVDSVNRLSGLYVGGIMAHFPLGDEFDSPSTGIVFSCFEQAIDNVRKRLPAGRRLHIANSGGVFHFHETCLDMVRPGIALYGCYPEGEPHRPREGEEELQPVMRFSTRVIQVRKVPAGHGLGYGQTFITKRATTIAVLPVGYEDGYSRRISNRGAVLIRGRRAPVVGRISMNLTLVDVTDFAGDVQRRDEAVLLGRQGDEQITADEIASWLDTISYEMLCLFGNLNNRYYVD